MRVTNTELGLTTELPPAAAAGPPLCKGLPAQESGSERPVVASWPGPIRRRPGPISQSRPKQQHTLTHSLNCSLSFARTHGLRPLCLPTYTHYTIVVRACVCMRVHACARARPRKSCGGGEGDSVPWGPVLASALLGWHVNTARARECRQVVPRARLQGRSRA